MKIAYNPKTGAALTTAPANNDITFDLRGLNIFVRGEKFKGTDTTYSVFKKHTSAESGGYNGLVPVPSYTSTNIRFLREDGTWKSIDNYLYTQITNQDLDTLITEGKWYYAGGGNATTNKPSGVDAYELYIGRNAIGYRYLKLITLNGIIWFRYYNGTSWTSWVRWYTDENTDLKVLQSATTTSNFRPVILGYTNTTNPSDLSADVILLVHTTTSIYAQPSTGSLWANKFIGRLNNTLTFSAGTFAEKTYNNSSSVTVNIPTHTSHLVNNSGFLTLHQSLADYVTLDTALTITGVKTFSVSPILTRTATITLYLNSTSNYTLVVRWLKGGTSLGTYNPSIGQHNTGGDGTGSICILPYPTETVPWNGSVGLFIKKDHVYIDSKELANTANGSVYFTEFSGGKITSSGNALTQANHSITIGGQTRTAGASTCNIINSLSVSTITSSAATNLTLGLTVNGVVSTNKTIPDLYAASIRVKNVRGYTRLTTYWEDKTANFWFNSIGTPSPSWYSGITIKGWSDNYLTWELASGSTISLNGNLYYRNGLNGTWLNWLRIMFASELPGLFTDFSNAGSLTTSISIGGTTKTLKIDADTVDGLHASDFKRTWNGYAGKTYIGWIKIIEWTLSNAYHFSQYSFILLVYRWYDYPAPESYTLAFNFGWDSANIVLLNSNSGSRIIENFRVTKTADGLKYFVEMYVNTSYTTYQNTCYFTIDNYTSFTGSLVCDVLSETVTELCNITTSPNNIVAPGYVKSGSSDSYVLLGGGGHKAISDFAPSDHTHLYIATTFFKNTEGTVADYKTKIHSALSGKRGIGKHIVVSDSIIRNWSNNSASYTPSSVASIISINGGYDGSAYGQFLVSSWGLGLGLLKYNRSFENIQWFIHSGNIGTQSVNYANSAGNAAIASKLGTSTIGAINVPIYLNEGTPTVVNLNSTVNNLINNLSIGPSTPTDNDYYISQYVGGGTTETSYYRRPHSALYSYIKNKAEGTWNINVTGNAASATKLTSSAGNAALPIYFSDGKPIACTASSIFSNLSNDGNNISITVAGLNRTLTVNYANSAGSVVWNNIIGKPDTFPVATHNHDDRYVKLNGTSVMTGDLTLSLGDIDRFIVFSYPATINPTSNSWRTGVLGSGDGEANYYVVQYQRINTSSSTWNTAFKIGQYTGTVMFTNNITIGDKVNYHAGNLAPQTLTLSTSPQTYITANGTNYTLKLPNSDPYTSARTPTAHTHPYLPLAGGTMNQGSHVVFPGTSTDASYGGSIEFREVNYVNTNQTDWLYAPGITFHWGGRSVGKLGLRSDGDLAWRDLSIIHSGNISSQSVNYANSAGYTKRLYANSISDLTTRPGDYSLAYSRFQAGVSNIFPTINNANGVITAHLHYGDYFALIGLSSDGRMYYRTMMDLTLDAGVTWNKVAWTTDIPTKVSQLTNDSGFITGGPYLPLTGGTLSGNLTVGLKDANRIISIAGNTSHLKMIAHTNATYIESGNKDWNGNTPLLITGYSGNKGSNLYLYFANIYCRNNSYVNLDSGNWSSYITIPTATSQLTNDSGFLTSRGYIGRTTVLATAAALSLTGIGNITPETASTYYLGASDKPWYLIFCRYFTSDLVSLSSSSNSGSLAYSSTSGYFYITANNIAANTSGGFVMKTVKNGVLSLIVLESASNYGQIKTTGDLYIGGRVSNTTALISSDAAHNMYISVQGKALLVCDSSENSIRRGKNLKDNITLGTTSCPWESLYVKNGVKLKGKTNYFSILAPNGTHSSDEIFSLPYTGGTLVTTNSPAMVKGWATYSFSYTNGTSSTYTMTFKAGGGVNIVDSPSYYEYYKGPGILIRITSNCKDTSGGTIKDSLMVWGLASDATLSLYITKTTVLVSGSTVHYYLVYCTNTSGTALTSGSGTLNFIYF